MNYHLFESEKSKVNMVFEEHELKKFKVLWKTGKSVLDIANEMKRNPIDITLLVIDQADLGKIKKRRKGIF